MVLLERIKSLIPVDWFQNKHNWDLAVHWKIWRMRAQTEMLKPSLEKDELAETEAGICCRTIGFSSPDGSDLRVLHPDLKFIKDLIEDFKKYKMVYIHNIQVKGDYSHVHITCYYVE